MSILTYALHYEGEFNKNSLGAVSEGAKLASELGGEAHAVVVGGDDLTDDLCATLGIGDAGIEADRVGFDNARAHCSDFSAPPAKEAGKIIEDEDTAETVEQIVAWLDERKLLA